MWCKAPGASIRDRLGIQNNYDKCFFKETADIKGVPYFHYLLFRGRLYRSSNSNSKERGTYEQSFYMLSAWSGRIFIAFWVSIPIG